MLRTLKQRMTFVPLLLIVAAWIAFQPRAPAFQLLGKPAPQFSLDLLDGGTFDLAKTKGNEIVILDFWAT